VIKISVQQEKVTKINKNQQNTKTGKSEKHKK